MQSIWPGSDDGDAFDFVRELEPRRVFVRLRVRGTYARTQRSLRSVHRSVKTPSKDEEPGAHVRAGEKWGDSGRRSIFAIG